MRRKLCCAVLMVCAGAIFPLWHGARAEEAGQAAVDNARMQSATQIAKAYFSAIQKGDIPTMLSLSDVPYSRDGKEILESMSELKSHFSQGGKALKKLKGIKILEVNILDDKKEIADDCFAVDRIIVEIVIGDDKEKATLKLCIKPGDAYKVIGIRG